MQYLKQVLDQLNEKNKSEPEYLQSVQEVFETLNPLLQNNPEYEKMAILERLAEPEQVIQFKVPWVDDRGVVRINRGYRVQYNSAIGPYKGGLRFDPSVNLSVLKFLGFEQMFKNALTTLPMGGGKGGSDFNPKGKSEAEIKRFCQSFMTSLYRYIGPSVDVPAGDIGVSGKEIGYLYGQYRRMTGKSEPGVLTGKGVGYGGSLIRPQATGYGLIYFVLEMLKRLEKDPFGLKVLISGSGNVATYAALKAQEYGMQVVGMSDRKGYILDNQIDVKKVLAIKANRNGSLIEYGQQYYREGSIYDADIFVDLVLPCATQNEIDLQRAQRLVKNGCFLVAEGANMPNNNEAIAYYLEHGIYFAPGKAANAGGVATSGLEMTQNSMRLYWTEQEVDQRLQDIMQRIHQQCLQAMKQYGLASHDYVAGANLAAAQLVIDAMIAQGDY